MDEEVLLADVDVGVEILDDGPDPIIAI